jgi:hypothetical protein
VEESVVSRHVEAQEVGEGRGHSVSDVEAEEVDAGRGHSVADVAASQFAGVMPIDGGGLVSVEDLEVGGKYRIPKKKSGCTTRTY